MTTAPSAARGTTSAAANAARRPLILIFMLPLHARCRAVALTVTSS
jgi:hypothetical protein